MENDQISIIRKIVEEGFGEENLSVIDTYVSDDIIEHQAGLGKGKEGLKRAIQSLRASFPDLKYSLQQYSQKNDTVWVHYKATGTQTGQFMHLAPTGKKIDIDVMDVGRIENGKLVEHWGVPDRFAVLMQLGLLDKK